MNVELPSTGCNILSNNGVLYNYNNGNRTRTTFVIYEGVLHKSGEQYSSTAFSYNGDCLTTGDLVFNPQSAVYFHHIAILFAFSLLIVPTYMIFRKFWRPLK